MADKPKALTLDDLPAPSADLTAESLPAPPEPSAGQKMRQRFAPIAARELSPEQKYFQKEAVVPQLETMDAAGSLAIPFAEAGGIVPGAVKLASSAAGAAAGGHYAPRFGIPAWAGEMAGSMAGYGAPGVLGKIASKVVGEENVPLMLQSRQAVGKMIDRARDEMYNELGEARMSRPEPEPEPYTPQGPTRANPEDIEQRNLTPVYGPTRVNEPPKGTFSMDVRVPQQAGIPRTSRTIPPIEFTTGAPRMAGTAPEPPRIASPESMVGVGEGRPATWSNEEVLRLAKKGDRDAIQQMEIRRLTRPENMLYVAGPEKVRR